MICCNGGRDGPLPSPGWSGEALQDPSQVSPADRAPERCARQRR